MTSDDEDKSIGGVVAEFRRSTLMDASKKLAWWVLASAGGGLALLVWKGGSVPAWSALVAVIVTAVAGVWWRGRTKRLLVAERRQIAEDRDAVVEDAETLGFGLERHESYSKHVAQSLDALQRVVSGDIEVPIPRYIEQAILEPARDLLMDKPAENVRLSVLLPDEDGEKWWMPWAAGHTLTGKTKYDVRIVDSLSRHAYETGKPGPT